MPSYLVEIYLARGDAEGRAARERRARSAAAELTGEGTRVRFDRTIHVPEDEICFFVFEAPSGGDAALAAQRAELEALRVVEAVSSGEERAFGRFDHLEGKQSARGQSSSPRGISIKEES